MVDGDNFEVWEEKGLNFTFKKIILYCLYFYVYVFTPKSEILFFKKKSSAQRQEAEQAWGVSGCGAGTYGSNSRSARTSKFPTFLIYRMGTIREGCWDWIRERRVSFEDEERHRDGDEGDDKEARTWSERQDWTESGYEGLSQRRAAEADWSQGYTASLGFPGGSAVKNPPANAEDAEDAVPSLGWKDS